MTHDGLGETPEVDGARLGTCRPYWAAFRARYAGRMVRKILCGLVRQSRSSLGVASTGASNATLTALVAVFIVIWLQVRIMVL